MNKKQKEQAYKEFEEMVDDIWHKYCSQINNGTQDVMFLEDFSDASKQLIDKTVQQERERILGVIEKKMMVATKRKNEIENDPFHPVRCQYLGQEDAFKFVISLITNNSDINN